MTQDQVLTLMAALRKGRFKLLFVSPEKLVSPSFTRFLRSLNPAHAVQFACVDEAHCVSEWSHNFRPSYLQLKAVLKVTHVRACVFQPLPGPLLACHPIAAWSCFW